MIKYFFIQDNNFLTPFWKLSCDHAKFIFIIFRRQLPAILIKLSANYVPKTVAAFHANQSWVFQRLRRNRNKIAHSEQHKEQTMMMNGLRGTAASCHTFNYIFVQTVSLRTFPNGSSKFNFAFCRTSSQLSRHVNNICGFIKIVCRFGTNYILPPHLASHYWQHITFIYDYYYLLYLLRKMFL